MSQVVPTVLGTIRTGILEGVISGTSWDVQVVPALLGTMVRTEILEGVMRLVGMSPRACWDHRTVHGNPRH